MTALEEAITHCSLFQVVASTFLHQRRHHGSPLPTLGFLEKNVFLPCRMKASIERPGWREQSSGQP